MNIATLDRRAFLLGAGATATALAAASALAQEATPNWEDAVKRVVGEAKPAEGRVTLDMPEIAENGNTVPFSISVDSPMTERDYVKAIHVISTGNPQPGVASFRFTPVSGKASVSSRMRLARSQDVIGLAEMSDGRYFMTRRPVKVTIGGCGG